MPPSPSKLRPSFKDLFATESSPESLATRCEQFIASLLEQNGWEILTRNYRRPGTEIDLIIQKTQRLVFVEVKYRKRQPTRLSDMEAIINTKKKRALKKGALYFLSDQKDLNCHTMRFDLAIVWQHPKPGLSYETNFL